MTSVFLLLAFINQSQTPTPIPSSTPNNASKVDDSLRKAEVEAAKIKSLLELEHCKQVVPCPKCPPKQELVHLKVLSPDFSNPSEVSFDVEVKLTSLTLTRQLSLELPPPPPPPKVQQSRSFVPILIGIGIGIVVGSITTLALH